MVNQKPSFWIDANGYGMLSHIQTVDFEMTLLMICYRNMYEQKTEKKVNKQPNRLSWYTDTFRITIDKIACDNHRDHDTVSDTGSDCVCVRRLREQWGVCER